VFIIKYRKKGTANWKTHKKSFVFRETAQRKLIKLQQRHPDRNYRITKLKK